MRIAQKIRIGVKMKIIVVTHVEIGNRKIIKTASYNNDQIEKILLHQPSDERDQSSNEQKTITAVMDALYKGMKCHNCQ